MKKLLVGITVLSVFLLAGTTLLAGSSAPKTLCYIWEGSYLPQAMMTLKALGTLKTASGPVKHYAVQGTQLYKGWYPPSHLTGTATFINGILYFTHTSIMRGYGSPGSSPTGSYWEITGEGTFDPATGTGQLTSLLIDMPTSAGAVSVDSVHNVAIQAADCRDLSIVYPTAPAPLAVPQEGKRINGMAQVE